MINQVVLSDEIRTALVSAYFVQPGLLEVADLIGIARGTIASCLEPTPQTVNNYATGRYGMSYQHADRLRGLLRKAHAVGLQLVMAQLANADTPLMQVAAHEYSKRFERAGDLLSREGKEGKGDAH